MQNHYSIWTFAFPIILCIIKLVQCAPQAHEMTASARRLGPRYQVLKEYMLSGQKNVRYETKPIQYQDAQGENGDWDKSSRITYPMAKILKYYRNYLITYYIIMVIL